MEAALKTHIIGLSVDEHCCGATSLFSPSDGLFAPRKVLFRLYEWNIEFKDSSRSLDGCPERIQEQTRENGGTVSFLRAR